MADSITAPTMPTYSLNLKCFCLIPFKKILKNKKSLEVTWQKLIIIMKTTLLTEALKSLCSLLESDSVDELEVLRNFSISQDFWKRNDI